MEEREIHVTMELLEGYEFKVRFDGERVQELLMDEPAPLGEGKGPSAAEVLSAAAGNCLGASALFCLRRGRINVKGLKVGVMTSLARNEQGRLRIGQLQVRIRLDVDPADRERMGRCLALFEEFCIVTQSVRSGIDVNVQVDAGG